MTRRFFALFLLVTIVFTSTGLASCGFGFGANSPTTPILGDAGFRIIDLAENRSNIFAIVGDSVLLVKDAIKLVTTITANQTPPPDTTVGHMQISILYNKQGVNSQDVYDIITGRASLGILLEGGKTFESFTGNSVEIDATQTQRITIVPLQNATSNFTISARKGWQNTGIFLKRGKQFKVRYLSGTWTISKSVGRSDAAGQPVNPPPNLICHCGEPLDGYSTQALIGRIGGGVGYAPLQVGDDFSGVSYDNDFLYLRINLPDQLLFNSSGTVTVSIETDNV